MKNNTEEGQQVVITEGSATIKTAGKVFYNPVQQFNRDLSLTVISTYGQNVLNDLETKQEGNQSGITILEALSATGLRSIRYAKEITGVKKIVANDISHKAYEDIRKNVRENDVENIVVPSQSDAITFMYQHKTEDKFDVIDLDPYGCPSIFLDSAVQAVNEGGLLLITATDMAVLAGNTPEACYAKYGAVSLRMKSCHEMAVRILLQTIESHANRYGRYIEPILSLSADFYVRVFVRVFTSPYKCKYTLSKLSHVYHCTGCGAFTLHPLGILKANDKNQVKFSIPTGPPVGHHCQHCKHTHHVGGPIWSAPIHCKEFVAQLLQNVSSSLATFKRIHGVLNVIYEELGDIPLYYTIEKLAGTIHCETPSMTALRSAILNAGYNVSSTHMNKTGIKTTAPAKVLWDIMRCWQKLHPVSKKRLSNENSPATNILAVEPEQVYSFETHKEANPQSRKSGFVRFQMNPLPFWGPGTRSTAMVGKGDKMEKSKRNQGKRKREASEEDTEVT